MRRHRWRYRHRRRIDGDGGERASGVELECVEWSDQLQREAVDDEWGTVHDDRQSDDDELHEHGTNERDDVLLRGVGGERGGRECQLQPGKCDAHGEHSGDQLRQRVHCHWLAAQRQRGAERNAAAADRWWGGELGSSAFFTTPVNVQSFTTNFSFQMTSAVADGMAFVIQNGAATALGTGGGGSGLGYQGIGNSVAVKFDIYNSAGEGTDSTGIYLNGAAPTVPAVDMTSSGVSSGERRRDERAAQLQRDHPDT